MLAGAYPLDDGRHGRSVPAVIISHEPAMATGVPGVPLHQRGDLDYLPGIGGRDSGQPALPLERLGLFQFPRKSSGPDLPPLFSAVVFFVLSDLFAGGIYLPKISFS